MENAIVRYSKAQYEDKIRQLEGCLARLDAHQDTLEGLKEKVRDFWDDPQTPQYLDQLTKAIIGVRNAKDRTNKLMHEYKGIIEEMHGVESITTGWIDGIANAIGGLGITE